MITPLDSRVMDANAEALGVSVKELMGNAGRAVAEFLKETYPGKRYAFFCGQLLYSPRNSLRYSA